MTKAAIELATKRVQWRGFAWLTVASLFVLFVTHHRWIAGHFVEGFPAAGVTISSIFAGGAVGIWVPDIVKSFVSIWKPASAD